MGLFLSCCLKRLLWTFLSSMPAQQHFKLYTDAGHFPEVLTCCCVLFCFVSGNILMGFSL